MWAVDFVHDALRDGRRLKILTVVGEYSKAAIATIPARSIKARDVTHALERLMTIFGPPKHLRSDNGPEFLAKTMRSATRHGSDNEQKRAWHSMEKPVR